MTAKPIPNRAPAESGSGVQELRKEVEKIIRLYLRQEFFGQFEEWIIEYESMRNEIVDLVSQAVAQATEAEVIQKITNMVGSWTHNHALRMEAGKLRNDGCRACFRDEVLKDVIKDLSPAETQECHCHGPCCQYQEVEPCNHKYCLNEHCTSFQKEEEK